MDQNLQEINSISTIFQMYFKHSQRYIQRINYSMFEYRTHSIPFRKRCFRALFYFSASLYMAFIMIMGTYIPYIRFFLEIEQQMLGFKDMRLYGSFSGAIILMDTYKWYSTFQKLINYRYPLNEILIKLDQTVDENLNISNRQSLIKFFTKSYRFTLRLNSLFKYEIVFIAISSFPKYNEKFFKMLYDWNARNLSQLIRTNVIKFKRIICLREIIKRNLFLQAISRNSYGFYFGQVFFIDKLKLIEMFLFNFVFFILLYKKMVM
ncbi:uncharacterized protein LOC113797435 [Dermatophagoides pteronyssinus]|uniref:uncharacterized protein LOC113797435 n=1 Tax=Dermatophagoides pteronyssinus TaxID=6956 RepID=UPI003F677DDC